MTMHLLTGTVCGSVVPEKTSNAQQHSSKTFHRFLTWKIILSTLFPTLHTLYSTDGCSSGVALNVCAYVTGKRCCKYANNRSICHQHAGTRVRMRKPNLWQVANYCSYALPDSSVWMSECVSGCGSLTTRRFRCLHLYYLDTCWRQVDRSHWKSKHATPSALCSYCC